MIKEYICLITTILCLSMVRTPVTAASQTATLSASVNSSVRADIAEQQRLIKLYSHIIAQKKITPVATTENTYQESLIKPYLDSTQISVTVTDEDRAYLKDAVVLVTGFAGPIGSTLVKELLKAHPKEIVALDRNDTEMHHFRDLIAETTIPVHTYLADIAGEGTQFSLLSTIFETHRPTVIFHLANYKSLVLGNSNPNAYIINNIGTAVNLLTLADKHPIDRFVYVSSGKAGAPDAIYSQTKRLSEMLFRYHAQHNPSVKFGYVRFSNPVDTSGCFVMRTFLERIKHSKELHIRTRDNKYPARHFTRRIDNVQATILAGTHARAVEPCIIAFNTAAFKPLHINDLIRMIATQLAIPEIDQWYDLFVKEMPLQEGELLYEVNPDGVIVKNNPHLVEVADSAPTTLTMREAIHLVAQAYDISPENTASLCKKVAARALHGITSLDTTTEHTANLKSG